MLKGIKVAYISVISLLSVTSYGQLYKDPEAVVADRVEDLLRRMTLEEKVEQLSMTSLAAYPASDRFFGICSSPFESVEQVVEQSVKAKRHARENSRLGIPPIQIAECLHGQLAYSATIFPQAIAQGSTWNPALIEEMAL